MKRSDGRRAVVIGGGMAGLLAARVLAESCGQVTLLERDRYPAEPVFRAGVPQGRHVHVLLAKGQALLEDLFPGFIARLVEQGAVETNALRDHAVRYPTGWLPRATSPLSLYCCTRPLLEGLVRQELLRTSPVKIVEGYEVTDLHFDARGQTVTGVHARRRGHEPSEHEPAELDLEADLVVEASGRDSHILRWLEAGGFPLPQETVLDPSLGYASCFYQPAPGSERPWHGMIMATYPPHMRRGGTITPVEGGRWHVVLAGTSGDYPPTEPEAFLDFARGMLDPAFAEALESAERVSPIYGYRRTANRWRHFERLRCFPAGLFVIGDAVCAFDPVYGQGMSVAAMGAQALKTCLIQRAGGQQAGLSLRFQRTLARLNRTPWELSVGADYRALPPEAQTRGWLSRLINRYFDRMTALMPASAMLCLAFGNVAHLLNSPVTLFHPTIVWTVFTTRKQT